MLPTPPQAAAHRRRSRAYYVLAAGAVAVAGGLAYRAAQTDAAARARRSLAGLRAALRQYADALATGGDIVSTVLRDLRAFLASGDDEIPPSLRQLAKLAASREAAGATATAVAAVCRGVAAASGSGGGGVEGGGGGGEGGGGDALGRVLEALLSDRGHSLVSLAVAMGAKNAAAAYVEAAAARGSADTASGADRLLDFLATPGGRDLAVAAAAAAASAGVRVYMDAAADVNLYDDFLSSLAKPAHLAAVKECVAVLARGAVAAAMRGDDAPAELLQQQRRRAAAVEELPATEAAGTPGGASSSGDSGDKPGAAGHDDLDSDGLLHVRGAPGRARAGGGGGDCLQRRWVRAVGDEVLHLSRDPAGRGAMASLVGVASREAAAGVGAAVAGQVRWALALAALLLGVLVAWAARAAAPALLQATPRWLGVSD